MKITIDVPVENINNALTLPHSRYWCREVNIKDGIGYAIDWAGDGNPQKIQITKSKLRLGLIAMAKHNPTQFAALLSGDSDGITGDVLLQFITFGEEKYC